MKLKNLVSILLCLILVLSLVPVSLADDEENELTDIEEFEQMTYREDGLPDIDIYSWKYILANQHNSCGVYCAPNVSYFFEQGIDSRIYDDAVALVYACQEAGNQCYVNCAYRNWEFLLGKAEEHLKYDYDGNAYEMATHYLCPGCNEHQTGLAFDITADIGYSANYDEQVDDWTKDSSTWEWIKQNCADYGFIVRYPEGKEQFYGITCNADTHLRYVGRVAAKYITENNLCLEEFLMLYGYPVNLPNNSD